MSYLPMAESTHSSSGFGAIGQETPLTLLPHPSEMTPQRTAGNSDEWPFCDHSDPLPCYSRCPPLPHLGGCTFPGATSIFLAPVHAFDLRKTRHCRGIRHVRLICPASLFPDHYNSSSESKSSAPTYWFLYWLASLTISSTDFAPLAAFSASSFSFSAFCSRIMRS